MEEQFYYKQDGDVAVFYRQKGGKTAQVLRLDYAIGGYNTTVKNADIPEGAMPIPGVDVKFQQHLAELNIYGFDEKWAKAHIWPSDINRLLDGNVEGAMFLFFYTPDCQACEYYKPIVMDFCSKYNEYDNQNYRMAVMIGFAKVTEGLNAPELKDVKLVPALFMYKDGTIYRLDVSKLNNIPQMLSDLANAVSDKQEKESLLKLLPPNKES